MHSLRVSRRAALAASASFLLPSFAAEAYPGRSTRIVVPLGTGGQMDALARAVATALAEQLGQSVFVDNRPGAAGQIGADLVAKAVGDPYTLFMGSMGIMTLSPHLYPNLPYEVRRDFTPIALCGTAPYALIVNPRVIPVRTVGEFLAWARAQKAPVPYGTFGSGSVPHIAGVMLSSMAGLRLDQVPYRAPTQITTELIKGDLPMIIDAPASYMGFFPDDRLRALAVTSRRRMALLPDVPTLHEAGLAGFDLANWFGIFAPRDLPAAAAARLKADMAKALRSRKLQEQFLPQGVEVPLPSTEDFASFTEKDRARWKDFFVQHQIKLDKM